MKKYYFLLIATILVFVGCTASRPPTILAETDQYYFIPAGVEFTAVIIDGEAPQKVTRTKNTWAVDAGYLAELQEEANANALESN